MNFLAHMLLSGEDPAVLTGNFMGDFVKGRLDGRFSDGVRRGVELHRRIDSYAERDPHFRESRQRLDASFGLYRGILVDLFYDHFLVRQWDTWSNEPFDAFLRRTRRDVAAHQAELPVGMQRLVPIIFDELLPSYGRVDGIAAALSRMSRRVSRPNPLARGATELERCHDDLAADFAAFMPGLMAFAREFLAPPR